MDPFVVMLLVGLVFVAIVIQSDARALFLNILDYAQTHSGTFQYILNAAMAHVLAVDLIGIAIVAFATRLFFVPLPMDPYIILAYEKGINIVILALVTALFGAIASLFNYFAGILLANKILNDPKNTGMIDFIKSSPFVAPMIVLSAILPLPDLIALVFGVLRVGAKKFFLYTIIGIVAKVYVLIVAIDYVRPYLQPFL